MIFFFRQAENYELIWMHDSLNKVNVSNFDIYFHIYVTIIQSTYLYI